MSLTHACVTSASVHLSLPQRNHSTVGFLTITTHPSPPFSLIIPAATCRWPLFPAAFPCLDGFHKVVDQSTTLADKTSDQVWEFIHPCAQRDKPELLIHVKRKVGIRLGPTCLHAYMFICLLAKETPCCVRARLGTCPIYRLRCPVHRGFQSLWPPTNGPSL